MPKSFTIIDFINEVGVENCKIQFLTQSIVKLDKKKHDTEITFATDQMTPTDFMNQTQSNIPPPRVGVVVWMPGPKFKEIQMRIAAENAKEQHVEQPAPPARRASGLRRPAKRRGR